MPKTSATSTQNHIIRRLKPADLDAVVDLSLLAWEPVFVSFERILGTGIFDRLYRPDWRAAQATAVQNNCIAEASESFVATTTDDFPVAFIVLKQDRAESIGVVDMIAVHPQHQRRGHARALMEFAIQRFSVQELQLVSVGTGGDPGHAPARALYEAVGFTGVPLVNYYMANHSEE